MPEMDCYASVPQELKQLPNWVGWKLTPTKDNKITKIPYSSTTELASSNNPNTWRSFDDVCRIPPEKEKGIGFVFCGNGIIGIDLDHCLNDGVVDNRFKHIIEALPTYSEISPSGTGIHLFLKCRERPYETGRKREDFEIYSTERYFTITGNQYGTVNEIREFSVELIRALADPFLNPKNDNNKSETAIKKPSPQLSDEDIIRIISHSSGSTKFERLMSGSTSDYANDSSRADMALASILAFYTQDAYQIERIMRSSGLARGKWDTHKTYLQNMTIQKAIRECNNYYTPTSAGDIEHGASVAESFLSQHTHEKPLPKNQTITELTDAEIKAIKESIRLCDNLPPLPEITHPLFKKWMDIGERLMYSHKSYHFGNLLPIASMALGKRVSVLISTKYTYSNLYLMLVGTSTISGKSFSSDTAIQEFGIPVTNIPTLLNPEDSSTLKRKSWSNPRVVQDISRTNHILWYYDEAKEFFDESGERGWNAPIIGNLCTAYDGSSLEISRSNKSNKPNEPDNKWVCEHPFLSLLFNMTISQLQEASTPKIVSSGFFYRWMWFLENGGEKRKNVTATTEDIAGIKEIRDELIKMGTALKRMQPNDICFNVNDKIEQWSMDISKRNDNELYQSATGRSVIHIYKIAMIFAMFDPEFQKTVMNRKDYPIRVDLPERWVDEAIKIVETYLLPRVLVVVNYSEKVDRTNKQLRVLESIKSFGGIADHSKLLRRTKLDCTDFAKAIRTLLESEEIRTMKDGSKTMYYVNVDNTT